MSTRDDSRLTTHNSQRNCPTLLDLVYSGLPQNTTGVAIATKRQGRWIETPPDRFRQQVDRFALGLYDLGVRPGARVSLHGESSAEWVIADVAILSLGAASVPIYTTQPADQIEYILNDASVTAHVVSTPALYRASAPALASVGSLRATIGIHGPHGEDVLGWQQVLDRGGRLAAEKPELLETLRAQVSAETLATLIYTSGTTGTPKGVMLSHGNIASNVLASLERMPWDIESCRGQSILSYLPLSHVFERMLTYLYLHIGYPIYFVESFEQILEDLQHVKPVHFSSVPRLLEKVYAGIHNKADQLSGAQRAVLKWGLELADAYDVERPLSTMEKVQYSLADALVYRKLRALFGGQLQAITSGGAALSKDVMNFLNAIGIFCGQGYGLTETSPVITVYTRGRLRAGSVGTPISGVEVMIAEDGEILARGPNVMQGYHDDPGATAEVMAEDGWFHTGDIGHIDGDGFLFITDRKKELMKLSTGKYIAPQPIEARLSSSPLVEQAVVVGNSRQFCSALIVVNRDAVAAQLDDGTPPAAVDPEHPRVRTLLADVVERANTDLPPWEQVKKFSLLTEPWSIDGGELTPTLKIKRRVIQQKHGDVVEEMYRR
jgi:long-chain acyl-CoA synthetase